MRFVTWATLLIVPFSVLACASQSAEDARQVKDLAARVRQLSTNYERLEERLGAVEALERYKAGTADSAPSPSNTRPDLPTVMAGPNEQPMTESASPEPSRAVETSSDDSHRLMIVGEGSRVETRVDGDVRTPTAASPPSKTNSRAAKRNPSTVTSTSSGGANP
jgi:hypothetical protein